MKKRSRKLQLNRETLSQLNPDNLGGVAGGLWCGSADCTNSCQDPTGPGFTLCVRTQCACPFTDTVYPVIC